MYTKICPICSKQFEAVNNHYKYCSDECRAKKHQQDNNERSRLWYSKSENKAKRKIYNSLHYKSVGKTCASCGTLLPDGRASFCLDCLLKDYDATHSSRAYQRLSSRGFDLQMIQHELNERR